MNNTTEWNKLDYFHLVEKSVIKDLQKKRRKVISTYMKSFSDAFESHTSDRTSNTTKFQELSLAAKTSESDISISNAALATTANTTMDVDSTMHPHKFMSSSSSSSISPISNAGSVNDISLPLTLTNSMNRSIDFSQDDNNDLQSSLTAQSMHQDNNEVLRLTCYLDDLNSHYAFQNHALVAKAKPCQFLRANELHFVQCMQSFLYIVCRSDPSDMDIQFFKVHFHSLNGLAASFLFYHVSICLFLAFILFYFIFSYDRLECEHSTSALLLRVKIKWKKIIFFDIKPFMEKPYNISGMYKFNDAANAFYACILLCCLMYYL